MTSLRVATVASCVALCGLLTACPMETKPAPCTQVVVTGCEHFAKITASPKDTPATKQQIIAHNDEYARACPSH